MKPAANEIPRRPLLWLAVAMAFTVPPMFRALSPWVPLWFLAALGVKFWMEKHGLRLRSVVGKLALTAVGVGGVKLTYHSLMGLEAGLSVFLVLMAVKILESYTARDFHIMALLGWFLSLTGLFISQEFTAGLYAIAAFFLVLAAVVEFNRGTRAHTSLLAPVATGARLLLSALPIVFVMFFLFPRGSGPIRFDLKRSSLGRSGMSNELRPGSVASLAQSQEVAFRVEFPDGNMPPFANMYWRGNVLTQNFGLEWKPSPADPYRGEPDHLNAVPVKQRIILQPHANLWIFALDWPATVPQKSRMVRGNVLRADRPVYSQKRYEVTSYAINRETELSDLERRNNLQVPADISPRVRDLVKSWKEKSDEPRAIVSNALTYFQKESFRYTLTPGAYDDNGLDEFLFKRRSGFCEHYAAAFATLMRVAGVPARVVIGYQGGQFNPLGKYLVVHQSDAHAWCEVWLPNLGWQRMDPTAVVAPGRVSMGLASFMDTASAGADAGTNNIGVMGGVFGRQSWARYVQQAWETLSFEWDSRISGFDDEAQQSFFLGLGWLDTRPLVLIGWLGVGVVVLMGLYAAWIWWRTGTAPDPVVSAYERFCRALESLGVSRDLAEGPSHFTERAARELPAYAEKIQRIGRSYIARRYSARAEESSALESEIRDFCRQTRK